MEINVHESPWDEMYKGVSTGMDPFAMTSLFVLSALSLRYSASIFLISVEEVETTSVSIF